MKNSAYFFCTFLLIFFSHAAKATPPDFCGSIKTKDINRCADYFFERADKDLNARYKDLISILSPSHKEKLIRTQRLWLAYRDSTCEVYKPSSDGTYADGSYAGNEAYSEEINCRTDLTESRTIEMETIQKFGSSPAYRKAKQYISRRYYDNDMQSLEKELIESAKDNQQWLEYANSNCKLTAELFQEDYERCLARQAFFRH